MLKDPEAWGCRSSACFFPDHPCRPCTGPALYDVPCVLAYDL